MSITLHQGSILDSTADFIVNPANSFLRHDGGLARVIAKAATGPLHPAYSGDQRDPMIPDEWGQMWLNEQATHPLIPTGGAAKTSAGHLPCKGIIHAVGPVYGGGTFCEATLLISAHSEALALARRWKGQSIAFPAISCGVFGYPVERASRLAIATCLRTELDVEFWLFEDSHFAAYQEALNDRR
jgi:O-acetyl-ADP-ribose deacetylase